MKLSLCMIVKNEEMHIERCLKSAQGIVDEIIIVDTGSTDRTIELAEPFDPKIVHHHWNDDFSAARNAGIDVAQGDYILVLDADEELTPGTSSKIKCALKQGADGYIIHLESVHDDVNSTTTLLRLFRNKPEYRFIYPIHEQIAEVIQQNGGTIALTEIRAMHYGYTSTEAKRKDKNKRNTAILESLVHLEHPYFLYQLAIEYSKSERYEDAYGLYRKFFNKIDRKMFIYPEIVASYMVTCIHTKRYDQAHQLFNGNVEHYNNYPELFSVDGKAYLFEGKYAAALNRFRALSEIKPSPLYKTTVGLNSYVRIFDIGQVYEKMGERKYALQCYQQAFHLKPNSYTFLSIIDLLGDQPDEMSRMIDDFSHIIEFQNEQNLNVFLFRLLLKGKKKSFELLCERFKETQTNKKLYEAMWTGDVKKAILELEKIDTDKTNSIIKQINKYIDGTSLNVDDLELPVALKWDSNENLLSRANESDQLQVAHLFYRLQGLESALPHYITLYRNHIYDEQSLYLLGEALRETGDLEAAIQMYRLSCKQQPTSMNLFRLIESAIRINEYPSAQLLLKDGITLFEESFLLNQARELLKKGDI